MMSVGEALDIYTGQLKAHQEINMDYFYDNIDPAEKVRFDRLRKVIDLTSSIEHTEKFDRIFEQLKNYRDETNSLSKAASFRKSSYSSDDLEDQQEIDEIFSEEFGDGDDL